MVPVALPGRAAGGALSLRRALSGGCGLALLATLLFALVPVPPRTQRFAARPAQEQRGSGALRAGAGRARIELPPRVSLAGFPGFRRAEGSGEPLQARALVLEAGAARLALVAVETLLVPSQLDAEVAAALPGTCLLLAATHTHSGPAGSWDNSLAALAGNGSYSPAIHDALQAAVLEAVAQALRALAPAGLSVAQEHWLQGPAQVRSAGPLDDALTVLRVGSAGKTVAVLVDYGMHPTVLGKGSHALSGDWPGAAARALEERTGGVALVVQGAGGNATWSGAKDVAELGARVASEALRLPAGVSSASAELSCAVRPVELPPAQASTRVPWLARRAATNLLRLFAERTAAQVTLELGGLRLVGAPGEPVGELGLAAHKARLTAIVGLADGYAGYVETPARAGAGEGEAAHTYYGPTLSQVLGLSVEEANAN